MIKYFLFESSIKDYKVTQERERYAIIITACAEHTDLEISNFLNCTQSFIQKVCCKLRASDGEVGNIVKCKKNEEHLEIIRTPEFVQKVQKIIDEDPLVSMRAIVRKI